MALCALLTVCAVHATSLVPSVYVCVSRFDCGRKGFSAHDWRVRTIGRNKNKTWENSRCEFVLLPDKITCASDVNFNPHAPERTCIYCSVQAVPFEWFFFQGSSCVMYSSFELRRYQFFSTSQWPGGLYGSPTITGSRPGAISAETWAAMVYHGRCVIGLLGQCCWCRGWGGGGRGPECDSVRGEGALQRGSKGLDHSAGNKFSTLWATRAG